MEGVGVFWWMVYGTLGSSRGRVEVESYGRARVCECGSRGVLYSRTDPTRLQPPTVKFSNHLRNQYHINPSLDAASLRCGSMHIVYLPARHCVLHRTTLSPQPLLLPTNCKTAPPVPYIHLNAIHPCPASIFPTGTKYAYQLAYEPLPSQPNPTQTKPIRPPHHPITSWTSEISDNAALRMKE